MKECKSMCDGCKHKNVCRYVKELEKLLTQVEQIRSSDIPDIFRLDVYCEQLDIGHNSK